MKRVFVVTLIYCLCLFVFATCLVIFAGQVPELLPGKIISFRINTILLNFLKLMPAALISSFLIAYTMMFTQIEKKVLIRFSPVVMRLFKKVVLAAIFGTALIALSQEVGIPLVNNTLQNMKSAPALYKEYIASSKRYIDMGLYSTAYQYAEAAQDLYSSSEEASYLMETCQTELDSLAPITYATIPSVVLEPVEAPDNSTSYELLLKAMVMFQQEEWINAHYYAMLALAAAEEGSANQADARILASETWNKIEQIASFENPVQEKLYRQKMEAYQALISGDILKAYYSFGSLYNQNPNDPDVIRYYDIASKEMQSHYFFFDEIPSSGILEEFNNIYFYATQANGAFYVLYAKGASSVNGTNGMIQYLRDVSIYQYTRNGKYEMSFYVPYAKVVAQPVSSFSEEIQEKLGVTEKNASVPLLMLESADRTKQSAIIRPTYSYANDSEGNSVQSTYFPLPINYQDFLLLERVSNPTEMNLWDLIKFATKANSFGYSQEVYVQAACQRICAPILYIVLFILAAVIGWNYRLLPHTRFRLIWVLSLPLINVIVLILLSVIEYSQRLVNYGLIDLFGNGAIPFIVAISIIVLIFSCVLFVSRRND
ncbi:MAG: hypothetical protein J6B81_01000 [Spirochaetaceae bacterium]|nr:hypothetical protein [Spirochaetaceae bacterium]